jgi:hypothetical protein
MFVDNLLNPATNLFSNCKHIQSPCLFLANNHCQSP